MDGTVYLYSLSKLFITYKWSVNKLHLFGVFKYYFPILVVKKTKPS